MAQWLQRDPVAQATPPDPTADASQAEVDIVDQAEAFQTLRVSDVMTPRADILALEVSLPLLEVVRRFLDSEHSRMPVYRESLDDPIGVVHIKDLMRQIAPVEGREPLVDGAWSEPVLHRLRRDLLYVPASMRAADLLLRMRVARIHMALVIDEFGGTDGLVTLEDLVEAVVGEISDEHDEQAEPQIVARPGGLLEADARVPLDELEVLLGHSLALPDPEEDIDTVAGLVVALAGRVPQRGEVIPHPDGVEFEVVEADPRRIRRLRIRPATPNVEPEALRPVDKLISPYGDPGADAAT
ncbi:hemolysin family protein [Caulobacter sp. S45]|uniref:hemolysin family protein n=1 Tax=Caulobacter sp. S45 TaxID=1641861 RepID=UPI00352FF87C